MTDFLVKYKSSWRLKKPNAFFADWTWTVTARNVLHGSTDKVIRLSAYGKNVTVHVTEIYLVKNFMPITNPDQCGKRLRR